MAKKLPSTHSLVQFCFPYVLVGTMARFGRLPLTFFCMRAVNVTGHWEWGIGASTFACMVRVRLAGSGALQQDRGKYAHFFSHPYNDREILFLVHGCLAWRPEGIRGVAGDP